MLKENAMQQTELLRQLKAFYSKFEKERFAELQHFYHPDIVFTDPVQQVKGLDALHRYFEHSISNTQYCYFSFSDEICSGQKAYLSWQMHFSHTAVRQGTEIIVPGVSHLVFDENGHSILEHTDYYDMGTMLYEHLPLLGWVTTKIKKRMTRI